MADLHTHSDVDYKPAPPAGPGRPRVRRRFWALLTMAACGAAAFQFLSVPAANAGHPVETVVATVAPGIRAAATSLPALPTLTRANLKVARGDTLAGLFTDRNLDRGDLQAILDLGDSTSRLKHLLPGDVIRVAYTPDGHIDSLRMQNDDAHMLSVTHEAVGFSASLDEIPTTVTDTYSHGIVENSLFDAATRAGLSEATTMQLIQLFAWDIDFAHDIQTGDSFSVLYQKVQRLGHVAADGPILAAEFHTGGKTLQIVRFTDPSGQTGYYTPDGHSIKKALMRAPISYNRISSGFTLHRKHPILGFTRAHQGVDYTAPVGTPIKAAGDGRVIFVGVKGGYGKCMIIDHGGGYATLYGHMSRFKKGMHAGVRVKQEQVIGYVGMTGLATGPHLHFEVHVNGVPRNPRTVQLPNVKPVQTQYLADFDIATKGLLAQLDTAPDSRLAGSAAVGGAVQTGTAH